MNAFRGSAPLDALRNAERPARLSRNGAFYATLTFAAFYRRRPPANGVPWTTVPVPVVVPTGRTKGRPTGRWPLLLCPLLLLLLPRLLITMLGNALLNGEKNGDPPKPYPYG